MKSAILMTVFVGVSIFTGVKGQESEDCFSPVICEGNGFAEPGWSKANPAVASDCSKTGLESTEKDFYSNLTTMQQEIQDVAESVKKQEEKLDALSQLIENRTCSTVNSVTDVQTQTGYTIENPSVPTSAPIEDGKDGRSMKRCPQTKYSFPKANQVTDSIRVVKAIEKISAATICAWLTPTVTSPIQGSIFSLATVVTDNALAFFFDSSNLVIERKSEQIIHNLPIKFKTHLCVSVSLDGAGGNCSVFENGSLATQYNFTENPIPEGGILIIGQDQDSLAGNFHASKSFPGLIENFLMWYRVLGDGEVEAIYENPCLCPNDYSIALTYDEIQLAGSVSSFPPSKCG